MANQDKDGNIISAFAYSYSPDGYITEETALQEGTQTERSYTYTDRGELSGFKETKDGKETTYT